MIAANVCPVVIDPDTKFTPVSKKGGGGTESGRYAHGLAWGHLQQKKPTKAEMTAWEKDFPGCWIGAICGVSSGGLEVLDFDIPGKEMLIALGQTGVPPAFEPWRELLIDNGQDDLLAKLVIAETVSGGRHVMFRSDAPGGNKKIAFDEKENCLIETRGPGGLIVCHPTPGYSFIQGDWESLPKLTEEERGILFSAAVLFDERPVQADRGETTARASMNGQLKPGDDFELRGGWDFLLDLGWKKVRSWRRQDLWLRPGKSGKGWSAKTGPGPSGDRMYVWSSSAGLPTECALTKFAVKAYLEYGGDYGACARALSKQGFGSGPTPTPRAAVGDEPKRFALTDLGNAERFAHEHGENLRYCSTWGRWLVWDGRRWEVDETNGAAVVQMASQTIRGMYDQASKTSDDNERKALAKWSLQCEARRQISNLVELAKAQPGIPIVPGKLDQHRESVVLANGIFDLKKGELLPHDRSKLLTRIIDIPFDPSADCPTWIQFLERVLAGDPNLMRYIWKAVGYSMTGLTIEQKFFFLWGSQGANGKSTFVETLMSIFGDYGRQTPTETLMAKPVQGGPSNDIARLKEARFVSAPETEDGSRLNEGLVKRLTGGDTITARYMHQEFFEFVPQFKIWMTGNHKPVIRGMDDAIWRRVSLIPFQVVIPPEERDPELKDKLRAEFPGILYWMIEGCKTWRKERLGNIDSLDEAVTDYKSEMDVIGTFIAECAIVNSQERVQSSKLYECYTAWAKKSGEYCLSQKRFSMEVESRGFTKIKGMTGASFVGLAIDGEEQPSIYRGGE